MKMWTRLILLHRSVAGPCMNMMYFLFHLPDGEFHN